MEKNLLAIDEEFPAAAEYLSGIYIINRDHGYVTNVKLAEWLGVTSSAVSQAVSRLKRLGLVRQKRYENVVLTEAGRATAVHVLRHHYLWSIFSFVRWATLGTWRTRRRRLGVTRR